MTFDGNLTVGDPLATWGGVECTVNRVGDEYFDQLELSGHAHRVSDLDRFAGLGLKTLRYPVLWEKVASGAGGAEDFHWPDERLARLRELEVTPIVGLLHHGSGPRTTSLVDPEFPVKLAAYARRVARRYPWVSRYTPVNEPLTTARFSGLYGHWYPHGRDNRVFVRALLNECWGTVLAMRAIRRVTPEAYLVQTEDMGFTRSTETLSYQAAFENERRFLSFDLLAGRVDAQHPLYGFLRRSGATEREIRRFSEDPSPPDLFGINYYVTSERFLDDRLGLYPDHVQGGNGRHRYADVEAVRVCREGLAGPSALLSAVWERYRRPVAITEAHLGCSVDQQVSWLLYVHRQAQEARLKRVDVRAVTVWALLGSHGWSNLVTTRPETYEPGVFALGPDNRTIATTPLADTVARLCLEGRGLERTDLSLHLDPGTPGWWTTPGRLLYPPYEQRSRAA